MSQATKIDYVEFPAKDLGATKTFFETVFGWQFVDYGPDYTSVVNASVNGGFYRSALAANTNNGSVLVVLYSSNLEDTLNKVTSAGGNVVKEIFSFPGGRRFHFCEPSGNELAVWSE